MSGIREKLDRMACKVGGIPYERMIDGKLFTATKIWRKQERAEKEAKKMREKGYYVRIIPQPNRYNTKTNDYVLYKRKRHRE